MTCAGLLCDTIPAMRTLLFISILLLPFTARASDWVALGQSPEARFELDRDSLENFAGEVKAWVKIVYRKEQPPQTISQGRPFDSSRNQYYVACKTRKYQVLQVIVYNRDKQVGAFHAQLDLDALQEAQPDTAVMFLLNKICAAGTSGN